MNRAGVGAAILAALLGLLACGQRGPLTQPAPPASPTDPQQAAPKPPPQDGTRR